MAEPTITYAPRSDTNSEAELDALATVYKFVLACNAKKEGGPATAPEDPERRSDEIRAKSSIPQ